MATRKSSTATRARKTPASKPTKAAKPAASTAAASADAPSKAPARTLAKPTTPVVVAETTPTPTAPAMKKPELIEQVVRRAGVKKRDAKPIVEAMLEVLGDAMAEGRELNLEPFGKTRINRVKQMAGARVSVVKLRQKSAGGDGPEKDGSDPLAPAAE